MVLFVVFVLVCGTVGADPSGAVDGSSDGSGVAAVGGFDDVGGGGVHAPAVEALEAGGVFEGTGCGDGLFCPGEPILRWVMAVWLVRVLDEEPAGGGETRFADVDAGEWWAPYVETLADLGVTAGCATGPLRFCPHEAVTRAQMASFLVRAFDLDEAPTAGFVDTAGNTHEANIDALAAAGVTAGCAVGPLRYCPAKAVTRAQMATFLARATGLVALPAGAEDGGGVGGTVGFDPFTEPALSDVDLVGLRRMVESLRDPTTCPEREPGGSLVDVAEVLRVVDGCLVVDYEPLGGRSPEEVQRGYADDPDVLAVGLPVATALMSSHGTDPEVGAQWHLAALGAEDLWDNWPLDAGGNKVVVRVAVIDNIVDSRHADLSDGRVEHVLGESPDGLGDDPGTNAHGTFVAGVIAAAQGNDSAGAGVAPDATILSFDSPGFSLGEKVKGLTELINEAVTAGADVINMSIGVANPATRRFVDRPVRVCSDGKCQDPLETAIIAAAMRGVVVVAAAGNCGNSLDSDRCGYLNQVVYPAGYPSTVSVGASTSSGDYSAQFTLNDSVDIVAPGEDILSTATAGRIPDAMIERSGSSTAAPMVSAVVAHLKARFPAANYCQITEALYDSAVLPPSTASVSGRSVTAGIVDPQAAITSLGSILASIQWAKIHQPGSVTPCDPPPMDTTPAILVSDSDHAAIGVGFGHACTLNEVGNIACWGNNDHGQHVPSDAGRFVSVAAGQYYTCAIRDDGTIDCWGNNVYIQADNIPGNKDEEFMSVTAGRNHICALRDDGTIACWGYPYDGQVSDAPTIKGAGHITDASVYTSISAGSDHTCAINLEGDIHCWGKEDDGRAANQTDGPYIAVAAGEAHTCALRKSGAAACWGNNDYGQATPPGGDFVQHNYVAITAGTEHTCGVKASGTILCWGNEADGRTTVSPRLRPADVMSNIPVIAAGGATTCALAEGATHCWGKRLTTNTGGTLSKFAEAASTITASHFHTCAIRDNGTVECWGGNDDGQADPPPGEFTAITSGTWHTCGIRTDGTAECWGDNNHGQADPPDGQFTAITSSVWHTCGLRTDRTAECWGTNIYGQARPPPGEFTAITAGRAHMCGIRTDGTAECWGTGSDGGLDPPPGEFTAITAGGGHTCGIRTDRTAECWGSNSHGQADAPPGEFTAITAGRGYTCGIRTDGTAQCWGWNISGQADAPPGEFTAITAGASHTCGIRTDGTAQCWGRPDGRSDPPPGEFKSSMGVGFVPAVGVNRTGFVGEW